MAQYHLSEDDQALLDCLAEARRLVRAGLADARVLDYIRRWEPVARSVRQQQEVA